MRIVIIETVKVVLTRVKAKVKKKRPPSHHAKHVARLKAERECFKGLAESLKKDEDRP